MHFFSTYICYIPFPSHPNNIWWGTQIMKPSLCSFLHSPVSSTLLGPNIFLIILLWNTLSQVSNPYKTIHKITALYSLFNLTDSKWEYKIQGMFNKRPNFLKSAPTSTGGVMHLQSTPSIRFSQQTAISPVSLWALVVKIHLLKWASAQAVRQNSDKVTIK